MTDAGNWCLIESDPGVFTELISNLGVKGTQVEEIYSLDDVTLEELNPIYGLIFLFKWQPEPGSHRTHSEADYAPNKDSHVFFAKQYSSRGFEVPVINNACATQAILSILLNSPGVELGDELGQFKEFTQEFSPELKGLAISNSDLIRTVHNSFARTDLFVNEEQPAADDSEDLFHFISYVPISGCLYELDGLQEAPINHGACTDQDWLRKARPIIQARMARYANSEIRFNLMAVVESRPIIYQKRMAEIDRMLHEIQVRIGALQLESAASTPKAHPTEPSTPETHQPIVASPSDTGSRDDSIQGLQARIIALEDEKNALSYKLTVEQMKLKRYRSDNVMRKHNFIPLLYNLVRQLAGKGQLDGLIEEAKRHKRPRTRP
ncbi:hypothetical protein IWQ60_001992 [Tieghemiomyces parasiticus]|uniref:Ubiquitin carboxyl-terminal hydrolase n=1 Tax=Tieghemiomyces parasiticus TaxID=78921 RepID=A0A9W8AC40_9FUNG|nr:hypothetical protein IWQ60_001992 [Tieghemiomyces parasiticus]